MRKYILFSILILLSVFVSAQSQAEMNEKAIDDYKKSDMEMTRVYKTVMGKLRQKTAKDLLLEAQRAWIKYKETHCNAITNQYDGGSIMPLIYYSCLEELTNQRKKQLERYLQMF
jgi:uncharacterized protein YecT (DUF1311 family)